MCTLDQALRQSQAPTQQPFPSCHLSLVSLVIETGQVQ
jgi:hypothetical protein